MLRTFPTTVWLVIFVGTNFAKQVNIQVSDIFVVLIFMVIEFGTWMLAVRLKAKRVSRIVYRALCSSMGEKDTLAQPD